MATILDRILETKRREIAQLRIAASTGALVRTRTAPYRSLRQRLVERENLGVIAEIKRKSPSKGTIQTQVDPIARARVYERAGAAAISVLTDREYFQGTIDDLRAVRECISVPVLRKDFIIDELQIDEAVGAGADVVLLIAAAMPPARLSELSAYAQAQGLEVLLEVHDPAEVEAALAAKPSILGINNRDLRTFEVDLGVSEAILRELPTDVVAIAESGVFGLADASRMAAAGARGILVGELLMRHANLEDVAACLSELQVSYDRLGNAR
ncbi:indole-3-glycerol phosphate synthase [Alicyclobacillus sacchari]|uniref:Indole-3-glycerol phosphate synthase n=1 Tax=Alicyclobacillus sacchari TaxID=392010 RepID=A0A4R8LSS4_9BACL|nr:indole-3-glycerol phosphate synthase TrpC [Alicyclobacillus sacchari]TDY50720.1 indole-3-glycerol phosphate synthase [Alicyclobacillus sacchari]